MSTTEREQIIAQTELYIQDFFPKNIPEKYVFHDLEHTPQTVAAARSIAEGYDFTQNDLMLLQLAVWFHDTGYGEGGEGHEERSCGFATDFLKDKISSGDLAKVLGCIRATKVPQRPQNLLEQIICDADLSHLGMKT